MNRLKIGTIAFLGRVLPARIKEALFHLSFHLSPSEFDKFAYEISFAPNMEFGLRAIAARGFSPSAIVDVGAFEGQWSRIAKRVWPESRLTMVEPNLAKQAQLAKVAEELGASTFDDLLGAGEGQLVQFNVMESGSSIMSERSPLPRTIERRRLRRLDSLLKKIEPASLLKIDAQGYELEILKGATGVLASFDAILLEIAIIEINEGAPLLHDVLIFMKQIGFLTYDLLEIHRRPLDQALNQVDIMFVREGSALIADKRHFAPK